MRLTRGNNENIKNPGTDMEYNDFNTEEYKNPETVIMIKEDEDEKRKKFAQRNRPNKKYSSSEISLNIILRESQL